MVVQHRRHVRQGGVRHEQEPEDRPEHRLERRAEPVGEDRDANHHEPGKKHRENGDQARHARIISARRLVCRP